MSSLIKLKDINNFCVQVSLNRPEKLNALTKPMWKELGSVFQKLSKNKNLRCIIIRGEGGKSFHLETILENLKNKDRLVSLPKLMANFYMERLGAFKIVQSRLLL